MMCFIQYLKNQKWEIFTKVGGERCFLNRFFIENSNTTLRKILNKEEHLDIVQNLIESILGIKVKKNRFKTIFKENSKIFT